MSGSSNNYEQHFIQVTYPHIRESVEFFQVRQAAANLNAFQRSLHTLGGSGDSIQSRIDEREELANTSAIPTQITEPLESRFKINNDKDLSGKDVRERLKVEQIEVIERLNHVRNRVECNLTTILNTPTCLQESVNGLICECGGPDPVTIQVRNAKGLPEFLLSATAVNSVDFTDSKRKSPNLIYWLSELQRSPLIRWQWHETDPRKNEVVLKRNAEVYAGGKEVLADVEVVDIYQRVLENAKEDTFYKEQEATAKLKIKALCKSDHRISINTNGENSLLFIFHHEGRKQDVQWNIRNAYVVFSSIVLNADKTRELLRTDEAKSSSPLITHTLKRNLSFDLVDFHIDKDQQLAVRACHPTAHLNDEELEFIACSVASEADRLEQILLGITGSD
jgi:hypothetical protein